MSSNNASIPTDVLLADVENELSDLYTDGAISAAIYQLKNQTRPIVNALIQADRHCCLQLKVAAHVAIFAPANLRTIFFARQKKYVDKRIDGHATVKTTDKGQYAYLLAEDEWLDVVSVLSPWAHAYDSIPIEQADAKEILENSLASQTDNPQSHKYQLTSGTIGHEHPQEKRFYVEPNSRKMILSESFDGDRWIFCKAQIAPTEANALDLTTGEIDKYVIRTPYFARQWLLMVTMQRLLSTKAAQAAGYFDLEQKFKQDAFNNKPGTGNIILSGDELDGGYENQLNDF